MSRYIVAVRREERDRVPMNWVDRLRAIDGVTVLGAANPHRAVVEANAAAAVEIQDAVGEYCHVEEEILHDRS